MREKRKHWYEIRAWADGWEIETQDAAGIWFSASAPSFYEKSKYRLVPDSEGWLPWYGGECQVDGDVEVQFRCQQKREDVAGELAWTHQSHSYDIIAYRIIKKGDPYAELKAAAKDPTKQIRCLSENCNEWIDSNKDGTQWGFIFPPENYEIRDKPKTKKVKLLAYYNTIALFWRSENTSVPLGLKRVPSEDKEIEVEE